jgi:hypothetical protein
MLASLLMVLVLGPVLVLGLPTQQTSWTGADFFKAGRTPSEYCCCSTATVDRHTDSVLAVLNRIVQRPYFRYFKVNIKKPCDYWAVSLLCATAGNPCRVCRCDADEVPFGLKEEPDMGCPNDVVGDGLNRQLAPGLGRVGLWKAFEDVTHEADAEYVDLVTNPEGFTGYSGHLANRIWKAVYEENCFSAPERNGPHADGSHDGTLSQLESNPFMESVGKLENAAVAAKSVCREQLVFYQLISGLHASISTHLSVRYSHGPEGQCGPNCKELKRRVLDHPDRMDNLYTLYLFLLRAATRAADAFLSPEAQYPMDQHGRDDEVLRQDLRDLFHKELLCSNTFNETKILESPQGRALIPQMKAMMMNITTLMNCLTCEKCRVWGKLQTMGLATAFKLVMVPGDAVVSLNRAEKVTLINFLRQVAFSVHSLTHVCREDAQTSASEGDL